MAVQMANSSIGAVDNHHTQWRCINGKGRFVDRVDNLKKEKAIALLDEGECSKVYKLIKDDIKLNDLFALYLYSTFSLPEWHESAEESDQRRIQLLTEAAKGGVSEAAYQLACCYLYGEGINRDLNLALKYAQNSSDLGYRHATTLAEQISNMLSK